MKGFYYLLFFFLLFVFSYADDSNETFYHPESFNFSLNESVGGPHVQLLATVDYFFNTSPENNVSFSFLFPQGFENFSFSCDGLCEGVVNQSTLILTTNNQSGSYHIEILFFLMRLLMRFILIIKALLFQLIYFIPIMAQIILLVIQLNSVLILLVRLWRTSLVMGL